MDKLTNQQIFDKVAIHLLTQNKKAEREKAKEDLSTFKPMCLYRGPNGTMCAAGVLIPDSVYKGTMEGKKFTDVVNNYGLHNALGITHDQLWLINKLQELHDTSNVADWRKNLVIVAEQEHLSWDVVLNTKALAP